MYKKIILFILLLIPNYIYAKTYYSDYERVNSVDGLDSDLYYIEEKYLYNTYEEEFIDKGYLEENDEYIKDLDDYQELIKEENIVFHTTSKKTKYIPLLFLDGNYKIYEIEVYVNGEKIDYETNDANMLRSYTRFLNDNDYTTFYLHKNPNAYLDLILGNSYSTEDIVVKIYAEEYDDIRVQLSLVGITSFILHNGFKGYHNISFITETDVSNKIDYTYEKEYLYRYYERIIKPTGIYLSEGSNLLSDDYTIEYEFYKRDKLVLDDEIVINSEYYNIDDYIKYSSDTVTYDCNINIEENGVYYCTFTLNNLVIKEYVTVSIDSIIDSYEEENNNQVLVIEEDNSELVIDEVDNNIIKDDVNKIEYNHNMELLNVVNDDTLEDNDVLVEDFDDEIISNGNKKDNKRIVTNIIKVVLCIVLIIIDIIKIIKIKRNKVEKV